ncbi:MAG TPA: ParA family partition ATPase [Candidatus Competibacteraceae bacterium]|nr:ParA family partition ATPase [Candidatus Competibacteraceae bacterium]
MAHVIAFLNPKGGTGKTTLSINIARAFQQVGYRVLIVDTDPQGTARDWRAASQTFYPEANMPAVVAIDRPTLETDIPVIGVSFDIIIIDGAAKLHQLTASALKAADTVLIPLQTSAADIWSAQDLVEMIKTRHNITSGRPKTAFVVNRQTVGSRLAADVDQALHEHGLPILAARTSNRVVYMEILSSGTTVVDLRPPGPATQEILALREELVTFAGLKPVLKPAEVS